MRVKGSVLLPNTVGSHSWSAARTIHYIIKSDWNYPVLPYITHLICLNPFIPLSVMLPVLICRLLSYLLYIPNGHSNELWTLRSPCSQKCSWLRTNTRRGEKLTRVHKQHSERASAVKAVSTVQFLPVNLQPTVAWRWSWTLRSQRALRKNMRGRARMSDCILCGQRNVHTLRMGHKANFAIRGRTCTQAAEIKPTRDWKRAARWMSGIGRCIAEIRWISYRQGERERTLVAIVLVTPFMYVLLPPYSASDAPVNYVEGGGVPTNGQ
jgi:hypothetical protein